MDFRQFWYTFAGMGCKDAEKCQTNGLILKQIGSLTGFWTRIRSYTIIIHRRNTLGSLNRRLKR